MPVAPRGVAAAVRVRHRAGVVAGALVAATLLVACGGGDDTKRLSAETYRARATEDCATLKEASDELRGAQTEGASGETVSGFMREAADSLRELVRGFGELEPPESLEADHDELGEALADYADGLDELADEVGADGTFRTTLDANPDVVRRLNGIADDATRLVERLELSGCLLPG